MTLRSSLVKRLRHRLAPQVRLLFEEAGLTAVPQPAPAPVVEQAPAPVEPVEQGERVVRKHPGGQLIELDYPVEPKPRWGYSRPVHPQLYDRINANRSRYADRLEQFLKFADNFSAIPVEETGKPEQPCWRNGWFPGLDMVALYSFLVLNNPERYIEVGSGNSTRVARLAIREHGLRTKITSIDPQPRAEIDTLCDRVIRSSLENADLDVFNDLGAGDVLFIDGSHRTLMNSDVTVAFLEVMPALEPGVLVHIHDIDLPWDHSPEWAERYYSEQYLLAAYILAKRAPFEIVMPNMFVSRDEELAKILDPLWSRPELAGIETHGGSFWVEMT